MSALGYNVGDMKAKFGCVWVISDIQIKYLNPGYVDDVLEVVTKIGVLKSATVTMNQVIQRVEVDQRTTLATAQVRAAVLDLESGKPRRFDPLFKEAMAALQPS